MVLYNIRVIKQSGGDKMCVDRESALKLLKEWTSSDSLLRHAYGVETAMRAYAEKFGEDKETWGMVGLLHDLDYEKFPTKEDHPYRGAEELRLKGYSDLIVSAVLSHAPYTGVKRDNLMSRALFAVDELVGFLFACAYVQPDKSFHAVKADRVRKKLKDKAFAKSVNREEIIESAAELNLELTEHIEFVRNALAEEEEALGFGKASA
jgi:predicted hydrolase (HD superfamily)